MNKSPVIDRFFLSRYHSGLVVWKKYIKRRWEAFTQERKIHRKEKQGLEYVPASGKRKPMLGCYCILSLKNTERRMWENILNVRINIPAESLPPIS